MNTARLVSVGKDGPLYLSVRDGQYVKIDRSSYLKESSQIDFVIYSQLVGSGHSEGMGTAKLASAIQVQWVKSLIPMLSGDIDIKRLNGDKNVSKEATPNEAAKENLEDIESKVRVDSKEDRQTKLDMLK